MPVIIVSGSVCTGKTTLAKALAEKLGFRYFDVNKIIIKYKLAEGYDRKYHSKIIDEKKLAKVLAHLIELNKNCFGMVIDSHFSHYLPKKYVDLCIITKCNLKVLNKRLKKRYPKLPQKVKINLETEIFDTCLVEATEAGYNVLAVDTTKKINIDKLSKEINKRLAK
ncbi:TPA: AAA family ATPase [Candidatus Woesearchaeota archaeon]|nr:AAA family ATPase [Candidatus Woesearchaeota archaeon]